MNTRERAAVFAFWLLALQKGRTQMNADFADETQTKRAANALLKKFVFDLLQFLHSSAKSAFICVRF